ncbi:MAG TPA: DUF177 domain-containing protein [Sorangium sp.]|nr:DUF177 domain-containing protein [Sorangium sp.]
MSKGKQSEIHFAAAQVPVDGLDIDVTLPPEWLDKALAEAGVGAAEGKPSPTVRGRLSRSGRDIVVRARVVAAVQAPCARCLRPALVPIDAALSLLLSPAPRGESRGRRQPGDGGEHEFTAAEADMDTYDGETIVLDDFVREAIMLEVPTFPLCEPDCPGIRASVAVPPPGNDIDPRLAPLNAFRKKDGPATLQDLVDAAAARAESMGRKPVLRSNVHGKKKKKGK